jgi:hypothetical protein
VTPTSIDVRYATADDIDRWNDPVERSPHGTPLLRLASNVSQCTRT